MSRIMKKYNNHMAKKNIIVFKNGKKIGIYSSWKKVSEISSIPIPKIEELIQSGDELNKFSFDIIGTV